MKSTIFLAGSLLAVADALPEEAAKELSARLVKGAETPIQDPTLDSPTVQGCFKSSGDLKFNSTIQWNSIGACAVNTCLPAGFSVGASSGGNQCWCGNSYPSKSDLVDDSNCNVGCTGYGTVACGGIDFWTVYNTGLTLSVKYLPNTTSDQPSSTSASSSSSPSSTSTPTAAIVTLGAETVVVTQAAAATSDSSSRPESGGSGGGSGGGSPNVAGIAAGVVVGVVVIASAIGGLFLYMRHKRNRELKEELHRNAAVNAFIGKPGSSGGMSMADARLDPVMAHRRLSDGSIADNQDYSRRILRVTNA